MRISTVTLFFLLISRSLICQIVIREETHNYRLTGLENYQQTISIDGINEGSQPEQVGFPVNELAELVSFQLYEKKGEDWKPSKLKRDITISTISRSSFFSGTKNYFFEIPAGIEFRLEFTTREKHSIFLTKCYRSGWFDAEHVLYNFDLAEGLQWTARNGEMRTGIFSVDESMYDSLKSFPYLIHPKGTAPLAYFSAWFDERINPQLDIDPNLIPQSLKNVAENGSREDLAKACFHFVQSQIKYIDIENGIHAIIPRHCEKVLKNGLGDCKDMATLLTALFRHFNFEAYSAISRTNGKDDIFDFPSVALANHAVCALHFQDQWYFLDATEDACLFEDPSIQILGTELFLVGYEGNPFLKVDEVPRSQSFAELNYHLTKDLTLELEMRTFGKMNHFLYYTQLKEKDPAKQVKMVLDQISGLKWNIDELVTLDSTSLLRASVTLGSSMYSKMGNRTLYNLQFLPDPVLMSSLFQNSRYPRFDGKIDVNLDFGGTVKSVFTPNEASLLEVNVVENELHVRCRLQKEPNLDAFKVSALMVSWDEFMKQPLLIEYEN